MKKLLFVLCWTLCCPGTQLIVLGGESPEQHQQPAGEVDTQILARTLAALRLQVAGDVAGSHQQLQQIIEEAPDAELARWSLGHLQANDGWCAFHRYVEETGRWPELYQYQQERAERQKTFADQLFLADGCRAHQLVDEERAHLEQTVRLDGEFVEGRMRLGHQQLNGVWVTPEQMRQMLARIARDQSNLKEWRLRVERLTREFDKAAGPGALRLVQQHLNEIRTPDAIPALEAIFARRSDAATAMYLNWAARVPSYETSLALARQAVFSENAELRVQALSLLQTRPYDDSVPWLLSGLETVKETSFAWEMDLRGFVPLKIYRTLVIDQEHTEHTLDHRQQFVDGRGLPLAVRDNPDGSVDARVRLLNNPRTRNFIVPGAVSPVVQILSQLEQSRAFVAWQSASQETRTARILQALSEVTGVQDNQTPEDWWQWWRDHNDYVLTKTNTRGQYSQTWFVDRRLPQPKPLRSLQWISAHSCFAAGTVVETEQGPKPIEKIEVGDRVLSQDLDSGRLSFKPVLETTTRPQATLLAIQLGSETMTCSSGHPFWVAGAGWRMAKELSPGARLHSVAGTVSVDSITPAGEGTVYNLVVADAHTYFAGTRRIYTHDVTRRSPTDQILPGLRKEF